VAESLPRPLRHEVFPGCTPAQLMSDELACTEACPTPCRVTIPDAKAAFAIEYDHGRYARSVVTTDLGTEAFETCEYAGATLVACTSDNHRRMPVVRDTHGRVTELGDGEPPAFEIEYDAHGDAVSVAVRDGEANAVLSYDRDHRLIAERYRTDSPNEVAIAYAYDARGNIATITSTHQARPVAGTMHLAYDAQNRCVRITTDADDRGLARAIAIEYDARGRLVRTTETDRTATREESHDVAYAYDCTAP
jgi:YD repeat-containing protein